MLLLERVNVYDVLAREMAGAALYKYKKILQDKDIVRLAANFRYHYEFPAKGVSTKWPQDIDKILECTAKFYIAYNMGQYPPEVIYFFNGNYSKNLNFLSGEDDYKTRPDIQISLNVFNNDFSEFQGNFDWQAFYFELLQTIRHELEHQVQAMRAYGIPVHHFDFDADNELRVDLPKSVDFVGKTIKNHALYTTVLASEVEAELKSYYLVYKKTKKSMYDLIVKALKQLDLDAEDIQYVIGEWERYRKKHFKYMPSLK